MIVVDVNVVAYFFIEGDKTALARNVLQRDPDWRLPALWRHEFLNILATFARAGGATAAEARTLWRRGVQWLGGAEQAVDMESALAIAIAHRVSAYDAQYLALARQLGVRCVTEDGRLLRAFPDATRTMRAFCES